MNERKVTVPVEGRVCVWEAGHGWYWTVDVPGKHRNDRAPTEREAWEAARKYVESLGGTMEDV